jgi:hypothetical protein
MAIFPDWSGERTGDDAGGCLRPEPERGHFDGEGSPIVAIDRAPSASTPPFTAPAMTAGAGRSNADRSRWHMVSQRAKTVF